AGQEVVREGGRHLDAAGGEVGRGEVGPGDDHPPGVGVDVHELLVGRVDRGGAVDRAVRVGGRVDDERAHPGVAAVGRAVAAKCGHDGVGRETGDDERGVDEVAAAQILDVRVAEDCRQEEAVEHVGAGRGELAAVDEGDAAVVRVEEAGERDRVQVDA